MLIKGLLLAVVLIGCAIPGSAQEANYNHQLVVAQDFHDHQFDTRKPKYLFAKNRWYVKYNPVTGVFGGLMFVYQRYVSQQISANCLYHQSCSRFSVACIKHYGIVKGIALSADRLMRCNQLAAGGVHPSTFHQESGRVIDPVENYQLKDH